MFASVIFTKEGFKPTVKLHHGFVTTDVDVIVFDRAPEAFDHDVVQSPTFAVHADPNVVGFEHVGECLASELTTLIGVENFRLTFFLKGVFQAFDTGGLVQAVTETPADNVAARPVHYGCEVDMAVT